MTTSTENEPGTAEQAVPEMDVWREQVIAIETPEDMYCFLIDIRHHYAADPHFYCDNDLGGTLVAIASAFLGEMDGTRLREVAVSVLTALSWNGEEIAISAAAPS